MLAGIGLPQHHHGDADEDEREQRADIDHVADIFDRRDAADNCCDQSDENRVFVGSAECGMNRGEEFGRQKAVVGHRVKHARLAEQHDEHDARETGKSAGGDQVGRFRLSRGRETQRRAAPRY